MTSDFTCNVHKQNELLESRWRHWAYDGRAFIRFDDNMYIFYSPKTAANTKATEKKCRACANNVQITTVPRFR